MTMRLIAAMFLALPLTFAVSCMPIIFGFNYPPDWPARETAKKGECAAVEGTYDNEPEDMPEKMKYGATELAFFFGLSKQRGLVDFVRLEQPQPDTLVVSGWRSGGQDGSETVEVGREEFSTAAKNLHCKRDGIKLKTLGKFMISPDEAGFLVVKNNESEVAEMVVAIGRSWARYPPVEKEVAAGGAASGVVVHRK